MLLTLSGPSAIGKDTWSFIAERMGFYREIPFTTREARNLEIEERNVYNFITLNQFQDLIRDNKLTEWDYILGNYYGTGLSLTERVNSGKNVVLQVLGRMAIRLKYKLPNVKTIMLQTSDINTLKNRYRKRGFTQKEIEERILLASEETQLSPLFDFIIPDADILPDQEIEYLLSDIICD